MGFSHDTWNTLIFNRKLGGIEEISRDFNVFAVTIRKDDVFPMNGGRFHHPLPAGGGARGLPRPPTAGDSTPNGGTWTYTPMILVRSKDFP